MKLYVGYEAIPTLRFCSAKHRSPESNSNPQFWSAEMRNLVLTSLAVLIAVLSFLSTSPEVVGKQSKFITATKAIPGQYIVVLADNGGTLAESQSLIEERSQELAEGYNAIVGSVFTRSFRDFTAKMSKKEAMELSSDERVKFARNDSEISRRSSSNIC